MKNLKYVIPASGIIFLFSYFTYIDFNQISDSPEINYSWRETDSTFALLNYSQVVWQLNFNKKQDKPYFHPLRINGCELTLERPDDHPWHRGLWFSWKYINKVNYWEEDPQKGYSEGRSKIKNVEIVPSKNFSATVYIDIEYAPEGKESLVLEKRTLQISHPDAQGNYIIDWKLHFTSVDSLLEFDRTPPLKRGGKIWGGYAGLGFRGAETLNEQIFTASTGWINENSYTGEVENAKWMDMSASLDKKKKAEGGITIFDHPKNPRHPSPWYVWFEAGEHSFFSPAILYNESLMLKPHKSLQLKYRVYIHSDKHNIQTTKEIYNQFQKQKI
jgi:hypothetical protein